MSKQANYWRLLASAPFAAVGLMSQVGPNEAGANLCRWLATAVSDVPETCLANVPSAYVWAVVAIGILGSLLWFVWPSGGLSKQYRRLFPVRGMPAINALYNAYLEPAGNAANSLLVGVCGDLYAKGDATQKRLAGLVQRVIDEERAALAGLSNAISGIEPTSRDDLQERTVTYFRAYQGLRTQIAENATPEMRASAAFKAWLTLDAGFLDILRHVSARPQFVRLLGGIKSVGWGEQQTVSLTQDKPIAAPWTKLVDVARLAYEATRNTIVATAAERGGNADNTLSYYCIAISRHEPIYGTPLPSQVMEQIDMSSHHIEVEDGVAFIRDPYKLEPKWTNLSVKSENVPTIISRIKVMGGVE